MELYKTLIEIVPADLHSILKNKFENEKSLPARIINDLLTNKDINGEWLTKRYELSSGMLNKTLTQVKDLLWEFNSYHIQTSFDDIFVLRQLLMQGKTNNALKFYNSLKKKFDLTQQWDKLDCLYTEGLRYAQIIGDPDMAIEIASERKTNSNRLHQYTLLYSEIIPEMIQLESYKTKKININYAYYIEELYQRSVRINHHVLIHNCLHLKYLIYIRFNNTPQSVYSIVNAMRKNAEEFKTAMAPITYSIALNNYVNFLSIYTSFGKPDEYIKQLQKTIHHGGAIAMLNFYYAVLEYYLYEKRFKDFDSWLGQLNELKDDTKFAQFRIALLAMYSFAKNDHVSFSYFMSQFYEHPSHLNFPDIQINLRILEAMMMLRKKHGDVLLSRLEALRIFLGRNLDKDRYKDERLIIAILNKLNEEKNPDPKDLVELKNTPYRNVAFLSSFLEEYFYKSRFH